MTSTIAEDKNRLRQEFLIKRNNEPVLLQESKSVSIFRNLVPALSNYSSIGLYVPIKSEVRTQNIHNYLLSMGIDPLYPAIRKVGPNKIMVFTKITDPKSFNCYKYGFPQPERFITYPRNQVDAIIVPGLIFDHHGSRIGYGNGDFDRYLSKFTGDTIGICYDFQLINTIPSENHDIKMNKIITEKRIIEILED